MSITTTVTRGSNTSLRYAILHLAHDNSFAGTPGEVLDLSATGAALRWTEVFGGVRISASAADGGYLMTYVRDGDGTGAAGAPATGTITGYRQTAATSALIEIPGTTDISAGDHEYWLFIGR